MTYEQTLEYIHSHKRALATPGLERIKKLMALLGHPEKQLKAVHVAGTNGKGSTCTMTAAMLTNAGYRTGLFISPYIVDFRERIQICGELIPREDLIAVVAEIKPFADQVENLVEFELITAAAFLYFRQRNCDIVVIEVGLGGKFDATNVLERPLVSVITPIGLDHMAFLGNTVEEIAGEKCGIIKHQIPVITSADQDQDALAVIMEHCANYGCHLIQPGKPRITSFGVNGSSFTFQDGEVHLALAGNFQVANAMTALTIMHLLKERGYEKIEWAGCKKTLANIRFPSRVQVLSDNPPVILDGAHNPHGAHALAESLSMLDGKPVTAIIGMMADKSIPQFFGELLPKVTHVILVTPHQPRSAQAVDLADIAKQYLPDVSIASEISEAFTQAVNTAQMENGAVLICGSLYLAGEILKIADAFPETRNHTLGTVPQ